MTYSVRIEASAARPLARLAAGTRRLLVEQIDRRAVDPHVGTVLKGELDGLRCVRVGTYRIVFEVRSHELLVLVARVGHQHTDRRW